MSNKQYTARGRQVDMFALASKNANKVALGNAGLNARGDKVTNRGIILKTQEEIEQEWNRVKAQQEQLFTESLHDIKQPIPRVDITSATANIKEDLEFEPEEHEPLPVQQRTQPSRRKISEKE